MADVKNIFANRLKKIRLARDMSQAELGRKTGITAATLSAYEKGLKTPNLSSAVELARALNISIDWLCGEEYESLTIRKTNYIKFEDIANAIIWLSTNICGRIDIVNNYIEVVDPDTGVEYDTYESVAHLIFTQKEIVELLSGLMKLKQLYDEEILSLDLYNSSVEGLINKYRDYIVNSDTKEILLDYDNIDDLDLLDLFNASQKKVL